MLPTTKSALKHFLYTAAVSVSMPCFMYTGEYGPEYAVKLLTNEDNQWMKIVQSGLPIYRLIQTVDNTTTPEHHHNHINNDHNKAKPFRSFLNIQDISNDTRNKTKIIKNGKDRYIVNINDNRRLATQAIVSINKNGNNSSITVTPIGPKGTLTQCSFNVDNNADVSKEDIILNYFIKHGQKYYQMITSSDNNENNKAAYTEKWRKSYNRGVKDLKKQVIHHDLLQYVTELPSQRELYFKTMCNRVKSTFTTTQFKLTALHNATWFLQPHCGPYTMILPLASCIYSYVRDHVYQKKRKHGFRMRPEGLSLLTYHAAYYGLSLLSPTASKVLNIGWNAAFLSRLTSQFLWSYTK